MLKSTMVFAYDADGARIAKENADKAHLNFYPFSNYEEEYEYGEGREVYRLRYATSLGTTTPQKQVVSIVLSDTGTTEPTPEVKPASEIQKLIDAAPAGSTVEVPVGTYAGNIVLKQGIKLHGAGPSKTILDGKLTGSVVKMASDTEITGFQIRNSGNKTVYVIEKRKKVVGEVNAGVFVPAGAKNVVVKDNYFDNNYEGLFVIKASNVSIENNLIVNQRYDGINISEGSDVKVLRNTIDKNKILRGIKVYKTALLQIKNNLVTNNNGGVYCSSVPTNAVISYNDVWSNKGSGRIASSEYSGCTAGAGSVSVDPKYMAVGANAMEKHELKSDSPVLKAGESGSKLGWTRPSENQPQPTQKGPKLISGVFYTHTDHLGSSSITVSDTGIVKQLADYYAYGSTRVQEDTSDYADEHLYTGKEYDEELGLYYYGARYYHPATGRFVSQDSVSKYQPEKIIADPQLLNLYSYSRNNPVTFIDPDGNSVEYNDNLPASINWILFGLDFISTYVPVVNDARDVLELQSGRDLITDEPLGKLDRGTTLLVFAPFVSGSEGRLLKNEGAEAVQDGIRSLRKQFFNQDRRLWSRGKPGDSYENLLKHFEKHGEKVGAKNVREYYDKANKIIDSVDSVNVYKIDNLHKPGSIDYYDIRTNQLVGLNNKGEISTFQLVDDPDKFINVNKSIGK